MKKLLLAISLLLTVQSFGQKPIEYVFVHEINLNKTELYSNAKKWIAFNYKNYKEVLDIDDKAEGLISGKGYKADNPILETGFNYNFLIEIKEAKWRFTIKDIVYNEMLGISKTPLTERFITVQKNNFDSLTKEIVRLGAIDEKSLKKKEQNNLKQDKEKTLSALKRNLYYIEAYFHDLDKSLYEEMIKKDDF